MTEQRGSDRHDVPTEAVISSREAFSGHLLKVRLDQVRLESGRTSEREIVEHPGAVAILATTTNGHVLLLEHFRLPANGTLLELPAGTCESDEEPEVTAGRELREETGYEAGLLTPLMRFYSSPGYTTEAVTLFRATNCRRADQPGDPDEVTTVLETPLADVPALVASGRTADATTLIGLLWLQLHPPE